MADDALTGGMVLTGAYRIVRLIGRGGMGEVYEATHERTGAPFAIKVLAGASAKDDSTLERFRREGEVTSRLRHPNIVKVFDFDRLPDGRPFLAMELLSGMDLAATAAAQGLPMPVARVASIVDQVSLALFAAHQAGIIHRDLKPANLFLESLPGSDRDLVRVLDFGISKLRNAAAGLTRTMAVLGTPHYMSPEQATGTKDIDERSDQFALATIVYELLTGRQAFAADGGGDDDVLAIVFRVVHQEPPSWASLGIALPEAVESVVRRGMAKAAADRYPTIRAFSDAFAVALAQSPVASAGAPASVQPTRAVARTMVLPDAAPTGNTTLSLSTGEATKPTPPGAAVTEKVVPKEASGGPKRSRGRAGAVLAGGAAVGLGVVVVATLALRAPSTKPAVTDRPVAAAPAPAPVAAPPPAPVAPAQAAVAVAPKAAAPAVPPSTVRVEIDEAPEHLSVREGDRALSLPLTFPRDGKVHHLIFSANGREDLAVDIAGADGARVSLGGMAVVKRSAASPAVERTRPAKPAKPAKPPTAPSKTRNEDIL